MEKEIFEELQRIFWKIIFDDSKSNNQKAKEIKGIFDNLLESLKPIWIIDNILNLSISEKRYLSIINDFIFEYNKIKEVIFEDFNFMQNEVSIISKSIVKLNAKNILNKILSKKILKGS